MQHELLENIAKEIGFPLGVLPGMPISESLLFHIFAACPEQVVVIISMEAMAMDEALRGILVKCKRSLLQ